MKTYKDLYLEMLCVADDAIFLANEYSNDESESAQELSDRFDNIMANETMAQESEGYTKVTKEYFDLLAKDLHDTIIMFRKGEGSDILYERLKDMYNGMKLAQKE